MVVEELSFGDKEGNKEGWVMVWHCLFVDPVNMAIPTIAVIIVLLLFFGFCW